MPVTKKLVFNSQVLPDGHLDCPTELAGKKNNHSNKSLPDGATWDDIQERVNFVAAVRKGIHELDAGQAIPHRKMKEEFKEWLSR